MVECPVYVIVQIRLTESILYYAPTTILLYTRRGRSRAQHVRQREADIEGAKKRRPVNLRRSKGEARRAEPTFGCVLSYKSVERCKWRGPKAEPMLWSPMEYRSRSVVVLPSIVLFRILALQQSVFPSSRALVLCAIA